tara:strand:+ start:1004 stop:1258 length:255 start_codon:yes stop_codon:yes gene_type:complete
VSKLTEEKTINEELLVIIKALSDKLENLERAVYNKDNLLMKSGFVIADTPTPSMIGVVGTDIKSPDNVGNMDWKDIHKMVSSLE